LNFKEKNYLYTTASLENVIKESFKEDCWKNQLPGMLPEIFKSFINVSKLNTWFIRTKGDSFLLEMAEKPSLLYFEKSIDPNNFLELYNFN
jgi:hypothetical protein